MEPKQHWIRRVLDATLRALTLNGTPAPAVHYRHPSYERELADAQARYQRYYRL